VTVNWTTSTDNVAVVGYHVYRNGVLAATVGAAVRTWSEAVKKGTTTYTVKAYDAAGNESLTQGSVVTKK